MKYVKTIIKTLAILIFAGLLVTVPLLMRGHSSTYHSPTIFTMDTTLDITIEGRGKNSKNDAEACFEVARRIESKTSRFKKESDVSKINKLAGISPVKVSDDTFQIINRSFELSKLTDGAFDITIAPVMKIWGFYGKKYKIPETSEIKEALELVGWKKVKIDSASRTVMLTKKGMEIDLGGIAKGYALDELCRTLRKRGVRSALVNFGGSIGVVGKRPDGKDWVIGIRNPRGQGADILGEVRVKNCFISTSGDYERFFTKNNKRYFHIFDPSTGFNPENTISATVIGSSGTTTDAFSTALVVMGAENGIPFMDGMKNYSCLVVDSNGKVLKSKNMKEYVIGLKGRID
ncbi:MAG: FAD:protein FMN transferase [Actinomycetota bacterium]|nr:FAD:protein FMN transferase [Actinomycetota bacterium]